MIGRAGEHLPEVDLTAKRREAEHIIGRKVTDTDLASYLMYPKVFKDYAEHRREYSDVSLLPTSAFFYGLLDREEILVDIDKGKALIVRQTGRSDTVDEEGRIKVFLKLTANHVPSVCPNPTLPAPYAANPKLKKVISGTSVRRCLAWSLPSPSKSGRKS